MEHILNVAGYILNKYHEITKEALDEMKLHKLLYFTQREAFAILGKAAFAEELEGWKFGPVSREVRAVFLNGELAVPTHPISAEIEYIANNVIYEYGALASWKLSELSHRDISWKNARQGLAPDEIGCRILEKRDIREDAKRIRPYDHVWDMYYDEFDDLDETSCIERRAGPA